MMFCQKEEIDHERGNHKGARDHRETQAAQARLYDLYTLIL